MNYFDTLNDSTKFKSIKSKTIGDGIALQHQYCIENRFLFCLQNGATSFLVVVVVVRQNKILL